MIALFATLAAAAIAPPIGSAQLRQICAVGSAIVADLPDLGPGLRDGDTYVERSTDPRSLFRLCPDLRLPAGFKIATQDVWHRVKSPPLPPGQPTLIYHIGLPQLLDDDTIIPGRRPTVPSLVDADGHILTIKVRHANRATVDISYACNTMCDIQMEVRYVRDATGWKRDTAPPPRAFAVF